MRLFKGVTEKIEKNGHNVSTLSFLDASSGLGETLIVSQLFFASSIGLEVSESMYKAANTIINFRQIRGINLNLSVADIEVFEDINVIYDFSIGRESFTRENFLLTVEKSNSVIYVIACSDEFDGPQNFSKSLHFKEIYRKEFNIRGHEKLVSCKLFKRKQYVVRNSLDECHALNSNILHQAVRVVDSGMQLNFFKEEIKSLVRQTKRKHVKKKIKYTDNSNLYKIFTCLENVVNKDSKDYFKTDRATLLINRSEIPRYPCNRYNSCYVSSLFSLLLSDGLFRNYILQKPYNGDLIYNQLLLLLKTMGQYVKYDAGMTFYTDNNNILDTITKVVG